MVLDQILFKTITRIHAKIIQIIFRMYSYVLVPAVTDIGLLKYESVTCECNKDGYSEFKDTKNITTTSRTHNRARFSIMRLLTHNYLMSNVKGTEKGFPLNIEATKIECEESPIDESFVTTLLPKIDYVALLSATRQIASMCIPPLPELPGELSFAVGESSKFTLDEGLIKNLHRVLFDVHVVDGHLVCPDTGRRFPITQGIPNMVLHEDEI